MKKMAIRSIQRCFDYPEDKLYSLTKKTLLEDNHMSIDELTKKMVVSITNNKSKLDDSKLDELLGI